MKEKKTNDLRHKHRNHAKKRCKTKVDNLRTIAIELANQNNFVHLSVHLLQLKFDQLWKETRTFFSLRKLNKK